MDLQTELELRLDPSGIMAMIGMTPDPWQCDVLRSRSKRIALLASRQIGKSTTVALLGLTTAYLSPGALVLIVAPVERQSELIFKKVASFHRQIQLVPAVKELTLSIRLENNSEIVALPGDGDTIRGFSDPRMIIIDEASLVPDALKGAVMPMLLHGGRLVMLGTPHGKVGWFYEVWSGADPSWERINAKASESPRVNPEILAELRSGMGDRQAAAEWDNTFVEAADAVFSEDAIERMLERDDASVALPALDLEGVWRGLLARL